MATRGKKVREVFFTIQSTEEFLAKTQSEEQKLYCFDVHKSWCGRCQTME